MFLLVSVKVFIELDCSVVQRLSHRYVIKDHKLPMFLYFTSYCEIFAIPREIVAH